MELNLSKIKAFVFDVDGVLTDGGLYAVDGDLFRKFDTKDCMALRVASLHDYSLGIISGGISLTIKQRFRRCGLTEDNIYIGSHKKMDALEDFCQKHRLSFDQVLYCGDDLPDIPVIKACGIGACPADAVPEVREVSDYVSEDCGGHLFVRHIVEMVMKHQGTWNLDIELYKQRF